MAGKWREGVNEIKGNWQIGFVVLTEAKSYRITYECARWYKEVLVQPGRYPLTTNVLMDTDGVELKVYNFTGAVLPGVVTGSDFTSLFCGNQIGKGKIDENVGETESYYMNSYAHTVADCIVNNDGKFNGGYYELLPDWQAERKDFEYNGEQRHTHQILKAR